MDTLPARIITLDEAVTQIRQACEDYQQPLAEPQPSAQEMPAQLELTDLAAPDSSSPSFPATGMGQTQSGTQPPENKKEKAGRRPFFFLVGAGISYPDVPLSSDITRQCKVYAQKFNITSEPPNNVALDTYSHWFDRAYPHPKQRQIYLRSLIENKPISVANFRLAHLLASKKIANLVVTLNFDDFISRALTLFGKAHIVCDHPATVERINPEQDDIQILHVHGTYWFYDCVNLRAEIAERALVSDQTNATMAYKLDDVLERSSPIVIGYSGWEDDVVMRSLKRRLSTTLPYNVYWFCHQKENLNDLPNWLKEKRQVCFILPESQTTDIVDSLSTDGRVGQKRDSTGLTTIKDTSPKQEGPTLKAQVVLEALHQAFAIDPPRLTQDPLSFFADQLSNVLPKNTEGQVIDHGYSLRNIIEYAQELSKEHPLPESQFKKALDALQSSRNREAIEEARKINLKALTEAQLRDLMDAMWAGAVGLFDNSEDELAGYELVIQTGDLLLARNTTEASILVRIADALNNKGWTLSARGQPGSAVFAYEEIARRLDDATDPAMVAYVAEALANCAATLDLVGLKDEALTKIENIMTRFGSVADPAVQESLATSLNNKITILFELDRYDQALSACEEMISRFGNDKDPNLSEYVAVALNGIGFDYIDKAKRAWSNRNDAKSLLIEARSRLTDSLARAPDNPATDGGLGYIAFLLGDKQEAVETITRALAEGGGDLLKSEMEAVLRHALPEDEEFRNLVQGLQMPEPKSA